MLTAATEKTVDRAGTCVYITWPNLAWTQARGNGPWLFGEYPTPPNPDKSWNFLFEIMDASYLAEVPLTMSSLNGPCMLRLKCESVVGAIALVQVLTNLGATKYKSGPNLSIVSTDSECTVTDPECTTTDPECNECWGTGCYKGWGGPCLEGCAG